MKKRYLVIVEKPSAGKWLEKAYSTIQNKLDFEIDIAPANNHIFDMRLKAFQSMAEDIMKNSVPFTIKNKEMESHFIMNRNSFFDERGENILNLVRSNSYDGIINACDSDEAGEFIFEYTLESLKLEDYPIIRFKVLSDPVDEYIRELTLLKS